jgi:hypothetical protein
LFVEKVGQLNIPPHIIDEKTIARIDIPISPRYVFVEIQNDEHFHIAILILKNLLNG